MTTTGREELADLPVHGVAKLGEVISDYAWEFNTVEHKECVKEVLDNIMDWHLHEMDKVLDSISLANSAEPCEEDCTPVRHARHVGSWDHHLRVEEAITSIRERIRGER